MKKNSLTNIIKGAKNKIYRRCLSANGLFTSSVGATTSLILVLAISSLAALFIATNDTNAVAAPSISLSISSDMLSFDLAPNSANGTFASSSNLTVNVELSGSGGYTVGIKSGSSSNATNLVNSSDSARVFSSISDLTSATDFAASTSTAATNYNGKWGYLPSKFNSLDNVSYRPAPSVTGDVLEETSGINDTGEYTIAIGARAGLDIAPGTYSNTFVIYAIANNGCNPDATVIGEARCMQDINDNVINSMEIDRQYTLMDSRDQKDYHVARMQDGRVWMTQNLDFDIVTDTNSADYVALTSENTDLTTFGSQNYLANVSGGTQYGYFCYDSDGNDITGSTNNNCQNSGDIIKWVPANATLAKSAYASWVSNNNVPYSWDGGDYYYYTSGTTGSDNNWTLSQCATSGRTEEECRHYHIGNYYNWSASVASNNTSRLATAYAVMGNSICPAGWRLPYGRTSTSSTDVGYYSEINYTWIAEGIATSYITSGSNATFKTTNNITGFNAMRTAPMYMVRAGYRNGTGSAVTNPRSYGTYQTSTISNSTGASYTFTPYFYNSGLYPAYYSGTYAYRNFGKSIRCVARQTNTSSTTVIFDGNGNSGGSMNNQTISANSSANLTSNAYTRTNYVFNGWNTKADGTGVAYNDAAKFYAMTGNGTNNVTLYAQWAVNVTIKTATGVSQVYVREVGSSTNLCSTSSTSGTACKLKPNTSYTVVTSLNSGYSFSSWNLAGAGSLSSTTSTTTTLTTGAAATTLTPSTTPNAYNITVNVIGGISNVAFTNATYGTQSVSAAGGTVSLRHNQVYNITVTLANGNYFLSWTKTAGNGTLGSESVMNTTFTPNAGTATLQVRAANTQIKTAAGVDSVTVSRDGSTICTATDATTGSYCNLILGTQYDITATLHQGYSFGSWSNTGNGTIGNSGVITTTFTPAQSSAIDVLTSSAVGNPYTVTVLFGNEHVTSVTIDGETFTSSGGTKTLTAGTAYTISGTTDLSTVAFTASDNGEVSGNTFTLYGDATLTAEGLDRIYMQNVPSATLATLMPNVGDETVLYDNRDDKPYTVAHMADGKYWMTQNLDLCIGCTDVTALTSENTHLTTSGSGAYSNGYTSLNGVITWTPAATAITSSYTISGTTVSPAWPTNNYTNPYSAEGGDMYVYTSGSTSDDTVFTSLSDCMTTGGHTEAECAHYHVGNYYSWSAAIASNNSSNYSSQYDNAVNDICPAGWRLPKGRAATDTASTREFGELFRAAGITSSLTATSYATNGFNNIRIAPLYFVRGGHIYGSSLGSRGSYGLYWSSTVYDSTNAYGAYFSYSYIFSATSDIRNYGHGIRCVAQ